MRSRNMRNDFDINDPDRADWWEIKVGAAVELQLHQRNLDMNKKSSFGLIDANFYFYLFYFIFFIVF